MALETTHYTGHPCSDVNTAVQGKIQEHYVRTIVGARAALTTLT